MRSIHKGTNLIIVAISLLLVTNCSTAPPIPTADTSSSRITLKEIENTPGIKEPSDDELQIQYNVTRLESLSLAEFSQESSENRLQWCSKYTNQLPQFASTWTSFTSDPLDKLPHVTESNSSREIMMTSAWYDRAFVAGLKNVIFDEDPAVMGFREDETSEYTLTSRQKVLNCKYFRGTDPRADIDNSRLTTVKVNLTPNEYSGFIGTRVSSKDVTYGTALDYTTASFRSKDTDLTFILVPYVDYLGDGKLAWALA